MLRLTTETDPLQFVQLLEQLTKKNGVHAEGLSLSTETGIPNIGMSIWFGGPFPPQNHPRVQWVSNIQSLKKYNLFNHILFMDKENFVNLSSKEQDDTISFCQANQLFLIFYQDIFQEKDEIETDLFVILNRARHEGNYGAASDVLRVLLLRRLGGLYFDTDCKVVKTFLPAQFSSTNINIHTTSRVVINDIIAVPLAKTAMDDLDLVCRSILEEEQKQFKDKIPSLGTGWTTHKNIRYEENYLSLPYHFIRRANTIHSTGPARFMDKRLTTKEISDQNQFDGKNVFYTNFAGTWISGTNVSHAWSYINVHYKERSIATWDEYQLPIKKDKQELYTHLCELLSYYHENEPRTIRFDFFRLDILQAFVKEGDNIELAVLQWLFEHQSAKERQQLEYVAFALFDSFVASYPLLFNAHSFPHLKKEAYLPEIATLIKMNDEKAISFFANYDKDLYHAACQFNEAPAQFNADKVLQRFIANKTSGHNELADLIGFNLLGQQTTLDLPSIFKSIFGEISFHENIIRAKRSNASDSENNFLYLDSDASYHVLILLDEHASSILFEQRILLNFGHAESYKILFALLEHDELSTNQRNYLTFCFQHVLTEQLERKERVLFKALSLEHYQFCKAFGLTSLELCHSDFSEIPWLNLAKNEEFDREILTWIATKIRTPDFGHFLLNEIGRALGGRQQTLFAIIDAANRCIEIAEGLRFHFSAPHTAISRLKNIAKHVKEGNFIEVFSQLTTYGFNLREKDNLGCDALHYAVKFENQNLLNALIELDVDEVENGLACRALATENEERTGKKPSFDYARFHASSSTTSPRCQNEEKDSIFLHI